MATFSAGAARVHRGALTLQAIFTLLNMLGLPKPIRDAVQRLIIDPARRNFYAAYLTRGSWK